MPAKDLHNEHYVNTLQAAEILDVNHNTLRGWRRRKKDGPPFTKIGQTAVYKVRDLMEFMKDNDA